MNEYERIKSWRNFHSGRSISKFMLSDRRILNKRVLMRVELVKVEFWEIAKAK